MRTKLLTIFAALLFVAGCETAPDQAADAGGTGGATDSGAQTAPAGEVSGSELAAREEGPQAGTWEYVVANVGDRVFFGFDKSSLTSDAREVLAAQADFLKANPGVTVTIEGHADERGTREYNLALGERRANSAKNYLVALGVAEGRIRTTSYGKERPAVLGHNEFAWSQNRRAVTAPN